MVEQAGLVLVRSSSRVGFTDFGVNAIRLNYLAATLREQATLHVDTLRAQGLYLPEYGGRMPIDVSAHWLMLSPFGVGSYEVLRTFGVVSYAVLSTAGGVSYV